MPRYVLMFQGADPPTGDIALIEGHAGVTVLDRTPAACLVEASERDAQALADRLPGWLVAPETTYPPPRPPRPARPD